MPNPFTVSHSQDDGLTIIRIGGYLDAHTAPEFERVIEDQIAQGNVKIIVDCGKLDYISSAGLGVFMGFVEEVRQEGGDIKICSLIPKVRQVFELLGFQQLYHIVDDRSAAVRKFSESPSWEEG
ncbi:MAG: STAS domain-containing protein [Acidobacteriota bacterium]